MTAPDPLQYGWWLASRASGIVALLLLTLATLVGLTMATRLIRRPGANRTLVRVHEHAAVTGLVAIAVHGLTLLGDRWLHPGLTGIAVPFAMAYRPVFTGLGILAGWLAALLGLSYYVRRRLGTRRWRKLHRLTSVAWLMGVVHAVGAGTDATTPWLRTIVIASVAPALGLLLLRLLRRPARRPGRRAPVARTAAETGGAR